LVFFLLKFLGVSLNKVVVLFLGFSKSPSDEGMTPWSSILAYLVPAKEEAHSKVTQSPQGPALRLGVEGKNYL
jgi:hypothetical protein